MASRVCRVLRDLYADRRGAALILVGVAAAVLLGFTGLAIDVGAWQVAHHNMQGAADQAAYSAVVAGGGTNGVTEAKAAAASMGFVDGHNGVTVTVNQPPPAPDPNSGKPRRGPGNHQPAAAPLLHRPVSLVVADGFG